MLDGIKFWHWAIGILSIWLLLLIRRFYIDRALNNNFDSVQRLAEETINLIQNKIEFFNSENQKEEVSIKMNVATEDLKNFQETNDIANLTLFLSSDDSKMITGSIIPIDGGSSI